MESACTVEYLIGGESLVWINWWHRSSLFFLYSKEFKSQSNEQVVGARLSLRLLMRQLLVKVEFVLLERAHQYRFQKTLQAYPLDA